MDKNRLRLRSLAYIFAVAAGTAATVYLAYVAAAANTTIGNNISTSGTLTVGNTALFSATLRASSTLQVTGTTTLYGALASQSSATSTFTNGFNISGGCFAVNDTCLTSGGGGGGGGSGTVNSGTIGQIAFYESSGTAVSGTSTISISAGSVTFSGNLLPSASAASTSVANATTTIFTASGINGRSAIAIGNDGLPVIVFESNVSLAVTHCGNVTCTSGNTTTDLHPSGSFDDLAITIGGDGFPIISYYEGTGQDLIVAHCGNALCSSGNATTTVDSTGDTGQNSSIKIGSDGFPIISYARSDTPSLKVIHCGNTACSSGNTTTVLHTVAGTVYNTSIGIPNDNLPIIAYRWDTGSGVVSLSAYKCANTACTSGSTNKVYTNNSTNGDGVMTSLAISNEGLPVLVFEVIFSNSPSEVLALFCNNVSCTGDTHSMAKVFTFGFDSFQPDSVKIAIGSDNLPIIGVVGSITDTNVRDIWAVKCRSVDCSLVHVPNRIDTNWTGNNQDNNLSLVVDSNSIPNFSYGAQPAGSDPSIRFAKCGNSSCETINPSSFSGGSDLGSQSQFFHNAYIESVFANQIKIKRFDLAEDYFSKENLGSGTIVALDPNYSLYIKKASFAGEERVIGIISSEPALVLSDYLIESEDLRYPVALAGRVPVKVNDEGGVISVGDPITLSSEPGVGKRATENSVIVGYALENYSGQIDGKILAFVDLDRWVPAQADESLSASLLSQAASLAKYWLEEMKIFIENGLLRVKDLIAEKLTANLVDAIKIKTKNIELTDSVTGEVYCVSIANGEWLKVLGDCAEEASEKETASSTPELNGPSQAPPPPPGMSALEPKEAENSEESGTATTTPEVSEEVEQ